MNLVNISSNGLKNVQDFWHEFQDILHWIHFPDALNTRKNVLQFNNPCKKLIFCLLHLRMKSDSRTLSDRFARHFKSTFEAKDFGPMFLRGGGVPLRK